MDTALDDLPLTMDIEAFGQRFFDMNRDAAYRASERGVFDLIVLGPRRRKVNVRATLRRHGLLPE